MKRSEWAGECLSIQREGEHCKILSQTKDMVFCKCLVEECIVKIVELLPHVFAEKTQYVLFYGSVVQGKRGNIIVFLGQNRVGKSTMLRYMLEEKEACCISDDIVFLNPITMELESNLYLPILYRTEYAKGVYEEKYFIPAQKRVSSEKKKIVFIYLVCGEGEINVEKIDGCNKVIILLASLWEKRREWISVISDLVSKIEMYRCGFDEISKRTEVIYSMLEGKIDEENT